jgi:hypothetical protein
MELVFTKGSGKFDLMEVFRTGVPPERVDCPKQRIIPHDMVHYALEHTRCWDATPVGGSLKLAL